MKIILICILLTNIISINYDETITLSYGKTYTSAQTFTKRTFYLQITSSYNYIKIDNYYGRLEVIKGDQTIAYLYGKETFTIFKYEPNIYYIVFELPSPFEICGFETSGLNNNYYLLESSLTFRYMQEKRLSFKVKNNESEKKFIAIQIYNQTNYLVRDARCEENGKTFSPIVFEEGNNNLYFIFLISDETTTFEYTLYNNLPRTTIRSASVSLKKDYNYVTISNNFTETNRFYNLKFYKLEHLKDYPYFELSKHKNTDLLFYEDNFNRYQINSVSRYKFKNFDSFLILNNKKNFGYFSVVYMKDEKNSIDGKGDFDLTLFDTRNFDINILNSASKNIKITFLKNEHFLLNNLFFPDKNKSLNYLFLDSDDKYNFIFQREKDETKVTLQFKNITKSRIPKDAVSVRFSVIPTNYEIITIEEDIFKCVDFEQLCILKPNSNKKKVVVDSNTSYSYFDGYNLYLHQIYNLNYDRYFEIIGNPSYYGRCFNIRYIIDEYIDLKMNQTLNFSVLNNKQIFNFRIKDIKSYYKVIIKLESIYNNIKYKILNEEYNKEKGFSIDSEGDDIIVNISTSLVDEHLCDNFSIYFDIEEILNKKYKPLIYASSIIGFTSILFFIIFLIYSCKNNSEEYNNLERLIYLYSFGKKNRY